MSRKQIVVLIEGGKAEVSTTGFAGKACQDATAQLQKALGVTTTDKKTPEYDLKEVRQAGN